MEGNPETNPVPLQELPAQPLKAGLEIIKNLGDYTSHISLGDIQGIKVSRYPTDTQGKHKEVIDVDLGSGQFIAVLHVLENGFMTLLHAYQRHGEGSRSPVLPLHKTPDDHPNPVDAMKALLEKIKLEPAETVQAYEKAA